MVVVVVMVVAAAVVVHGSIGRNDRGSSWW